MNTSKHYIIIIFIKSLKPSHKILFVFQNLSFFVIVLNNDNFEENFKYENEYSQFM